MPRVALQMPFAKFHGKAATPGSPGGQVVYSNGQQNISRALVTPSNPQSDHQTGIRSILSTVANGYQALSAANALAWRNAAAAVTETDPVGGQYTLTGIGLYTRINMYRQMNGQALTATPPDLDTIAAPTAIAAEIDGTNIQLTLTHGDPAGANFWFCRVTPSLGSAARRARANELRVITSTFSSSIIAETASPQEIDLDMDQFTLEDDQYIGVEIVPLSEDYVPGTPIFSRNVHITTP